MPLYLVETVTQFRNRYVIECKSAEHAEDTVVCDEAKEFSQKHSGENIIGTREITTTEFTHMNKELSETTKSLGKFQESGSPWMGEDQITRVSY